MYLITQNSYKYILDSGRSELILQSFFFCFYPCRVNIPNTLKRNSTQLVARIHGGKWGGWQLGKMKPKIIKYIRHYKKLYKVDNKFRSLDGFKNHVSPSPFVWNALRRRNRICLFPFYARCDTSHRERLILYTCLVVSCYIGLSLLLSQCTPIGYRTNVNRLLPVSVIKISIRRRRCVWYDVTFNCTHAVREKIYPSKTVSANRVRSTDTYTHCNIHTKDATKCRFDTHLKKKKIKKHRISLGTRRVRI